VTPRRWLIWLLCGIAILAATGCSRGLSPGEQALARNIFGDDLQLDKVRVISGFGLAPLPDARPAETAPATLGPRPGVCDRNAPTPRTGPPPAMALFQQINFSGQYYSPDTAPRWPAGVQLPQALLMAHELTHVWQWQNRTRTGYWPGRAALENVLNTDPYFYSPAAGTTFFGFGYEQQAALVEDYLCFVLFDPTAPRRGEVHDILAPVFPIHTLDAALGR